MRLRLIFILIIIAAFAFAASSCVTEGFGESTDTRRARGGSSQVKEISDNRREYVERQKALRASEREKLQRERQAKKRAREAAERQRIRDEREKDKKEREAAKAGYIPVALTNSNGDNFPPHDARRTVKNLDNSVRATYHVGYLGRETSTLACADKIWNSPLYDGCGQGYNPKCKLMHYPWTATNVPGDMNPNDSGMCGKLLKVTHPKTGKHVIVRAVDYGGTYEGGGLDLEPAAFNALDEDGQGHATGNLVNLKVDMVENDW